MALYPVTDLTATASDADTVALVWTNLDYYGWINIQYDKGSGWVTYVSGLDERTEVYYVDDIVPNTSYSFRLVLYEGLRYSNTDSAACWADTITDEIAVSESVSDYATGGTCSDTVTDTMYVSDFAVDATDIITNYAYYVATADGKVYEYSGYYKSDGGTAITARWESKDTDFAEQNIEHSDRDKTVEFARLHYIDKSAGARISVGVSVDGGSTWTTNTKNIGTGDNKGKAVDFFIVKTGQIFRFAIESASTSDEFQWSGLEIFYHVGGESFHTN